MISPDKPKPNPEAEKGEKRANQIRALYIKSVADKLDVEGWGWDYYKKKIAGYGRWGSEAFFQPQLDLPDHPFIESAGLIVIPKYEFPGHQVGTAYGVRITFRQHTPANYLIAEDEQGKTDRSSWMMYRTHWTHLFSEQGDYDPDTFYTDDLNNRMNDLKNKNPDDLTEKEREILMGIPRVSPERHLKWAGFSNWFQMMPEMEIRAKIIADETLGKLSEAYPDKFPDYGQFVHDFEELSNKPSLE